jgi:hypothetical protein
MRYLILLTLTVCSAVGAAEMWRWVDKDGVVHYADTPSPGAEKFTLQSTQKPTTPAGPAAPPARTSTRPAFRYASCAITTPAPDQVFNNVTAVNAGIELLPGQRPGDRILMQLNGRRVANWPEGAQGFMLTELFRGSYTLTAQIIDESGKTMCTSATVSFHIRQPSMQTPSGGVPSAPRVPTAPIAPAAPKPAPRP